MVLSQTESFTADVAEQVRMILADVFQVSVEEITPNLAIGDLPQWDSMGHMDVIMRLEEQFGVEVNTDMIAELINVPAICAYLAERRRDGP